MKTPPDRSGISFKVGAQLQARDRHKNWYAATIEKIDYDKERVLIHYKRWSRRHDEWFQWNSPYLRPLERVGLRRRGLGQQRASPLFVPGSRVLACWTDCRFYPAKILRVNKDDSYTVRFFDGVVRTVKPAKVKPFQKKSRCEKAAVGSEGWEEGDSEEGEEKEGDEEEEEEEDGKKEDEEMSQEKTSGGEERERKERADPSPSRLSAKKRTEEGKNSAAPSQPVAGDSGQTGVPNPAHIDRDVLLERQAHLPTTHKFSREPLYRVIKNQPPPILSIELDHNPFKCPSVGCTKSFRKASLLHYHIKYYHSDQQLEHLGDPDTPVGERAEPRSRPQRGDALTEPAVGCRRKRSSSEGGDFLLDRRSELQGSACHRDDREQGPVATEVKKEEGREKTQQERKERKSFLRVKLKKKKKKKKKNLGGVCSSDDENSDRPPIRLKLSADFPVSHSHVDDGSDWSTLTAESGEDMSSWPVGTEMEDCEVVRCVCEVDEENDFMIQCESCLCWQHGTCMGLYEDNVPQNYTCYYCRHTAGWRRVQRRLSEPDFMTSGHMFGLSCVKENYSEVNASKISLTSGLLAHTQSLRQMVSGLQLKISLLHSPSHPDLQLWRLPWRREDGEKLPTGPREDASISYVSSEHCYQKPGASWEKMEDRGPEKQDTEAEVKAAGDDRAADTTASDTNAGERSQGDSGARRRRRKSAHAAVHTCTHTPEAECQLNLLEHIESLHRQISTRMDMIERELDVLESWLDHSGELEPPDPLSRLPQLKQRIGRLLRDLCTVRLLAVRR